MEKWVQDLGRVLEVNYTTCKGEDKTAKRVIGEQ